MDWQWFKHSEMVHLFVYFLIKANHEEGVWMGQKIEKGQMITGLNSLKNDTGISIQTLRTCLKRLEKSGEINTQTTNKYTIITVCNFDSYQESNNTTNKHSNKQLTNNQQTTNKQLTTNKKKEKNKNERNIILPYQSELFVSTWEILINEKKWKGKSENALQESANILGRYQESVAVEMMKKSIASGWQGLFELKQLEQNKITHTSIPMSPR